MTPTKEAPTKGAPAKGAPAKGAPAKGAPAKEAPAKEAPAKEAPETEGTETEGTDKVKVCAKKEEYTKTRTASGKPSLHCGDVVALAFDGLDIDQKFNVTSALIDVPEKDLKEKYGHLNIGMQGMSLANRTRGALNKDAKAKEPKGLVAKLDGLVKPLREAQAKAQAKAKADAEAKAKAKADAEAEAEAKAKADSAGAGSAKAKADTQAKAEPK